MQTMEPGTISTTETTAARAATTYTTPTTPPMHAAGYEYDYRYDHHDEGGDRGLLFGMGAGTLSAIGAGLGGFWLFRRWQEGRRHPLNRFRRGMSHLGDQMPELDGTTGIGAGSLATGLALGWMLRSRFSPTHMAGELAEGLGKTALRTSKMALRTSGPAMRIARPAARFAGSRMTDMLPGTRTTGIGLGGILALGAIGLLVWRMLSGGDDHRPRYIGTPGVESALGRDRTATGELPREMGTERSVH